MFFSTLLAALKAVPEITGLIRSIDSRIGSMNDARDESQFEKFKAEINVLTKRIENAKSKEETAAIVAELNSLK